VPLDHFYNVLVIKGLLGIAPDLRNLVELME
jgi:hypothetical protein